MIPKRVLSTHSSTAGFSNTSPFSLKFKKFTAVHLNFYRVHLTLFIIIPFIASGVFYASNSNVKLSYIDSLFMVVSASTVTGLATIESSSMSTWQQVLLFILMCCGSTSFVSIITIIIRRIFFKRKFDYLISRNADLRKKVADLAAQEAALHPHRIKKDGITSHHLATTNSPNSHLSAIVSPISSVKSEKEKEKIKKRKKPERITLDMVRRVDTPVKVNQMNSGGWLREEQEEEITKPTTTTTHRESSGGILELREGTDTSDSIKTPISTERDHIEFDHSSDLRFRRNNTRPLGGMNSDQNRIRRSSHSHLRDFNHSKTLSRTGTYPPGSNSLSSGFGGLPNPVMAAVGLVRRLPVIAQFERSLTLPRSTTLASIHTINGNNNSGNNGNNGNNGKGMERTKTVSYLTFDTTVGRNSTFKGLTRSQEEELGGVEYRALTLLLKIVIGYWFLSQMIAVLIIAPYLTYSKTYSDVFTSPPNKVNLNPTWFVFFQVWSAWSNNGMSLVDASMVPFFESYLFIVVLSLLILMGNTAYPVFLRLTIWTMSKLVPNLSRTKETLQFLLDHPRRCFIYLFPSHQTWFLVFGLVILNGIDWVSFLVLDIGDNPVGNLPIGTRIINGLFQSFCVRSSGFAITNIAATAPALQFLYSVMMYVAVYPIALSVRSTNVYEEKSMGIFEEENLDDNEAEEEFKEKKSSTSYIAWHARKQLAFDMWWLVVAVWLICIVERNSIQSLDETWTTIFTIIFEVSSAYGTVGLSLGTPRKSTSLAGEFTTLSKLILVAVMIRGRHRGLPLAIDRAVLLPTEIQIHGQESVSELPETESPEEFSNGLNHPVIGLEQQQQQQRAEESNHIRDEDEVVEEYSGNSSSERTMKDEVQEEEVEKEKELNKNREGWTLET